ncbi:hypothetical protein ACHAW6_014867 [Cyclotella cf. meneghiniana]
MICPFLYLLPLLSILTPLLAQSTSNSTSGGSTTTSSYSCVDPRQPYAAQVNRGQNTTVCLYVGPSGSWNADITYKRFSVNVVADEFSSYRIPGSFEEIVQTNPFSSEATHVFASSQSALSFLRRYYDITSQRLYPYLTAIIDVRDGVVKGIAWDDACIFCQHSRCLANTYNFDGSVATNEQINQPTNGCFFTRDECVQLHAGGSDVCDLKLYIVWTGTAVGGKVLLSSDSRFSAFPPNRIQENIKTGVDSALGNLNKVKDTVTGSMEGAFEAVTDLTSGTRR